MWDFIFFPSPMLFLFAVSDDSHQGRQFTVQHFFFRHWWEFCRKERENSHMPSLKETAPWSHIISFQKQEPGEQLQCSPVSDSIYLGNSYHLRQSDFDTGRKMALPEEVLKNVKSPDGVTAVLLLSFFLSQITTIGWTVACKWLEQTSPKGSKNKKCGGEWKHECDWQI